MEDVTVELDDELEERGLDAVDQLVGRRSLAGKPVADNRTRLPASRRVRLLEATTLRGAPLSPKSRRDCRSSRERPGRCAHRGDRDVGSRECDQRGRTARFTAGRPHPRGDRHRRVVDRTNERVRVDVDGARPVELEHDERRTRARGLAE